MFLADWIGYRDGSDPAWDLRGTYSTEREMRRLLKARGGIFEVVASCARRAELMRVSEPQRGDVGLVKVAIMRWHGRAVLVPVGAICVGNGLWAIKPKERGLVIQPFPVMQAWGAHG